MRTRVRKWGNSLALRIPRAFAVEAGLVNDSLVDVSLVNGKFVIQLEIPSRPTLKQLLAKVTHDNLHNPVDTGTPVGNEIW